MSVAPGWYPDPADPATTRYWDGEGWADQPAPAPGDSTRPAPGPGDSPFTPGPSAGPAAPAETAETATRPVSPPPGASATPPPNADAVPPKAAAPPWWPAEIAYPPTGRVTPHGLALASPSRRLAARAIDLTALLVINLVFNGWFVYQWFREAATLGQEWLNTGEMDTASSGRVSELALIISLIAYALWFAYEVPVTHTRGQTLGKMLLGLRVIPMEGPQRLPFRRCFRRWQWFGLPFLLFVCCGAFGFVLPIVDNIFVATDQFLHLALHDRTARTYVVQIPARNAPLV